jgi:hypothetical protein
LLKTIDLQKPLDLTLWDYIMNNKPSMKYVLALNKIEKHLIAPYLAFAQIFQLQSYWQYGMHGSFVNVPKKLI